MCIGTWIEALLCAEQLMEPQYLHQVLQRMTRYNFVLGNSNPILERQMHPMYSVIGLFGSLTGLLSYKVCSRMMSVSGILMTLEVST